MSIRETLEGFDLFDNTILTHGFTDYMRDYRIVAKLHVGPSATGTYEYIFRGCVEVRYELRLPTEAFSLDDELLDLQSAQSEGPSRGFIWGVRGASVYPGWRYAARSPRAENWQRQL